MKFLNAELLDSRMLARAARQYIDSMHTTTFGRGFTVKGEGADVAGAVNWLVQQFENVLFVAQKIQNGEPGEEGNVSVGRAAKPNGSQAANEAAQGQEAGQEAPARSKTWDTATFATVVAAHAGQFFALLEGWPSGVLQTPCCGAPLVREIVMTGKSTSRTVFACGKCQAVYVWSDEPGAESVREGWGG